MMYGTKNIKFGSHTWRSPCAGCVLKP